MFRKLSVIILISIACGPTSHSQDTTFIDDWKWEVDVGLPFVAWQPYQFYNNVPRLYLGSARYRINEQWRARFGMFAGESFYDGFTFIRDWERTGLYGFDAGFEGVIWGTDRLKFMHYGALMYMYAEIIWQSKGNPEGQVSYDNGHFMGIAGGVSIQYAITHRFIASTELGLAIGPYFSDRYVASCNCIKFHPELEIVPSRWPSLTLGYRF